jgi:hypothetical protein
VINQASFAATGAICAVSKALEEGVLGVVEKGFYPTIWVGEGLFWYGEGMGLGFHPTMGYLYITY